MTDSPSADTPLQLSNAAFALEAWQADGEIHLHLRDQATGAPIADGAYVYRAARATPEGFAVATHLLEPALRLEGDTLRVTGRLAGLWLEQRLSLPAGGNYFEERLSLLNTGPQPAALTQLACGFQRRLTNAVAVLLPELQGDEIAGLPFWQRVNALGVQPNHFTLAQLLLQPGDEPRVGALAVGEHGFAPALQRHAEGWGWQHAGRVLGVFSFCQEHLLFSVLGVEVGPQSVSLRFGGAGLVNGEPAALGRLAPGEGLDLGDTRLVSLPGAAREAAYALRAFWDEQGCRFPADYSPPVHWNELYDNAEWNVSSPGRPAQPQRTRPLTYTRAQLLDEARKARDYGCQALYLDPGWDTEFGTLRWGEEWLGDQRNFVAALRDEYSLSLSLHCPLATWLSYDGRGVGDWPEAARLMDAAGQPVVFASWNNLQVPAVCLGARQYLDEAERRLLALCAAGATFLMFDGNWWNGGCWNPDHGHPVPYTLEDHCRANAELVRRVHARYPRVLIELHDPVTGGSLMRYAPVYYTYGPPGGYDENWGFELMWQPMEDLRSGRARGLYDYNLACNIPLYLHVDLRCDNAQALVLWWYASTCRHLGIGGTHDDPAIAEQHRQAMQRYRRLKRFYQQGEFYGADPEVHVHVLPDECAFVVNLFNLSDESRVISVTLDLASLGLDVDRWYVTPYTLAGRGFDPSRGTYIASRRLEPWSAQVLEVRALPA
jgi:hypothetical protein